MAASVVVMMGVAGAGKSTVARGLAHELGWDFAEGDDFHPAANVAKMAAGEPLTDVDRLPWLDGIAAVDRRRDRGRPARRDRLLGAEARLSGRAAQT